MGNVRNAVGTRHIVFHIAGQTKNIKYKYNQNQILDFNRTNE